MILVDAIIWFIQEHRKRILSEGSKSLISYKKKCQKIGSIEEVSFFLKSQKIPRLSQRAQIALSKWIDGEWPIVLSSKIPSPQEMLEVQAQGKRVVSWLPDIKGPILDKKDNWEFMLHDLMHAERFFYSPDLYKAQVGFFCWLKKQALDLSGNEWDYLRSDMNTHPLHAVQFLKHLIDCEGINFKPDIPHWNLINSPDYPCMPSAYAQEISLFFQNYKSKISGDGIR